MKSLKISDSLHSQIKVEAAREGVKIQEFAETALENWITKCQKYRGEVG